MKIQFLETNLPDIVLKKKILPIKVIIKSCKKINKKITYSLILLKVAKEN